MSDIGSDIAKAVGAVKSLIQQSMVYSYFAENRAASSIGMTTHSGSVYLVDIKPGRHELLTFEGEDYAMRAANVTVNGRKYPDVHAGYSNMTGALLVVDDDYRPIRRSSSLEKIELLG